MTWKREREQPQYRMDIEIMRVVDAVEKRGYRIRKVEFGYNSTEIRAIEFDDSPPSPESYHSPSLSRTRTRGGG